MKRRLLAFSALLSMGFSANAQFSGDFAPANWTTYTSGEASDASVDVSGAPGEIVIYGSNDGDEGEIFYLHVLTAAATITFDYEIENTDEDGGGYDYFRLYNGSDLLENITDPGETGTLSYDFAAGDSLIFSVYSEDGSLGPLNVTINNFGGIALPVTGGNLSAKIQDNTRMLSWTTFTETNNAGFEIQRSYTGKDFQKIGFVPARSLNGNSAEPLNYSYADLGSANGAVYYRYKQIDIDGKGHYSNVAALTSAQSTNIVVNSFPNPTSGLLNVITAEKGIIRILDVTGKVMMQQATEGVATFDLVKYPAGIYSLEFEGATNNASSKITKY